MAMRPLIGDRCPVPKQIPATSSADPIKRAAVLGPVKASPSGGREDAASLDRPCARRL
jgi:hypothetical protein